MAFEENYGSVLKDCSKAIALNGKSSKAYYRSGSALIALGRIDETLDCCNRCLAYDTNNSGIKALQERALAVKKETDRREREKEERLRKEDEAKMKMRIAFRVRFFDFFPFLSHPFFFFFFFFVSFTRNAT